MTSDRQRRVIVGVDDSLTGWAALRVAVAQAEAAQAQLYAVRVLAVASQPAMAGLHEDLVAASYAVVADAFAHALGGPPRSVPALVAAVDGPVGPALVALADRPDDLLVLGARRRRHALGHQPGRYCIARAGCPVLVVPAPELARAGSTRTLARDLSRELDELAGGTEAQQVEGRRQAEGPQWTGHRALPRDLWRS
jgi:nucleotide-binding universal stress UspA family protein